MVAISPSCFLFQEQLPFSGHAGRIFCKRNGNGFLKVSAVRSRSKLIRRSNTKRFDIRIHHFCEKYQEADSKRMTIMKKLAIILFALTIFFCALPPAQASNLMNGIQLFPADHILNIPIDTFPVDAKSSVYINNNGGASGNLFAAWGKQSGLGADVVDETIPKSRVTFRTSRFSDNVLYPIPPIPHIEGVPR